ncbi:MAG: HVO_0476 family zinc finger protein [Haloarculaceae archaeon]
MSESGERVAAECPGCSPSVPTAHEVLKPGGQPTVRCTECGHVHKIRLDREQTVERRVIVSQDDESFEARADVPPEESVAVGEEFLLDTEEAILTVRITSLELADGRAEQATAEAVETFWTRAVGNVSVNVTLHPKSGAREETRSVKIQVPGDEAFVVGQTYEYGDAEFTVESVRVRDDARGYDYDQFDHAGDTVDAKDVKRLYARDEDGTTTAWSAW